MKTISSWERGKIFFYSDLGELSGSDDAVRQQLSRLCKDGFILRYGSGIFYYPMIDTKYGLGVIPATNHMIAKAYAECQGIALYPTKDAAMNMIGISQQNQMNAVYLTDGHTRTIHTGIGSGIRLVHTSRSKLHLFHSNEMRLLAIALQGEQSENLSESDVAHIRQKLMLVPDIDFEHDIKLFTSNNQRFIRQCRLQIS